MSTTYTVPIKMNGSPVGTAVVRDDGEGNVGLASLTVDTEHAQQVLLMSIQDEGCGLDVDALGGEETTQ